MVHSRQPCAKGCPSLHSVTRWGGGSPGRRLGSAFYLTLYLMSTSWWTGPVKVTHWQLVACGRAPLQHQSMAEQDHQWSHGGNWSLLMECRVMEHSNSSMPRAALSHILLQTHKKDALITNYQGNASQKPQWDITSHLSKWTLSRRQIVSLVENVGEKEPSNTVGENVNWFSH